MVVDGRKPVLLVAMPILCFASFGVGRAQNISQLMLCRFLQALGGSSGSSLGSGVIGDIYKLEERGTAMGIFFAVSNFDSFSTLIPKLMDYFPRPLWLVQLLRPS